MILTVSNLKSHTNYYSFKYFSMFFCLFFFLIGWNLALAKTNLNSKGPSITFQSCWGVCVPMKRRQMTIICKHKIWGVGKICDIWSPIKLPFLISTWMRYKLNINKLLINLRINHCPRRDFAQKAKSRGGTLVTRTYIKESTYSWNIQSVCQKKVSIFLNRGREESVGNDDASIVCARKMVRMT